MQRRATTLTPERVRELLNYHPENGLTWRTSRNGINAGDKAGHIKVAWNGHVSRYICVDGKTYPASHIVWLWHTGSFPQNIIDHIDRNSTNDRFDNLREATQSQNCANKTVVSNTVGARGVYESGSKYVARIKQNGRLVYLGTFETVERASAAYQAARTRYFGEFSEDRRRTPALIEGNARCSLSEEGSAGS